MTALATPFLALATPLDRARSAALRAAGPLVAPLARDRELRVALLGTLMVVSSAAVTFVAPLWLLALGPIVFGVPHLAADLRYLVVGPRLHRRFAMMLLFALPAVLGPFGSGAALGLCVAAACAALARAPRARRAALAAVALTLASFAHRSGRIADLVAAHAHNAVALFVWFGLRRERRVVSALPIVAVVAVVVALFAGAAEPVMARVGAFSSQRSGLDFGELSAELAPGLGGALALRLVLAFAFAQSVHYGTWLRLIPEDARARTAPRTFRGSFEALARDLGWPIVALVTLGWLGLAGFALADLRAARAFYLRLVGFHGWIEIACVALALAEGRRPHEAVA